MKTIFRLLVLVLLVAGWALAAVSLHLVYTPGRLVVVPKNRLHYHDVYLDTRGWTEAELAAHPAVVRRMIETGKSEFLAHVVPADSESERVAKLNEILERGPTTAPAEEVEKRVAAPATREASIVPDAPPHVRIIEKLPSVAW